VTSLLTLFGASTIGIVMEEKVVSNQIRELTLSRKIMIGLGSFLIRALCLTLRYQLADQSGFLTEPPKGPVVLMIWHNRILALPVVFKRYYPRRKGLLVLTSASRDGAYLSAMVARFGMGSIRGSTSRRGAAALMDLFRAVRQGYDLCFTPDGPRGPRYKISPGAVLISQKSKAPILPVNVEYSACWRLKSWDAFMIPKPFSQVKVTLAPYLVIPPTHSDGAFEDERMKVEKFMTEALRVL
jgi:lysophospholipid acyltransferase (LPLAT)-like uncharacterized protein